MATGTVLASETNLEALRVNKRKCSDATIQRHVAILEKLALQNHGMIPTFRWLNENGFFHSYNVMLDYPAAFAHLKREEDRKYEIYKGHHCGKVVIVQPEKYRNFADYHIPGACFNPTELLIEGGLTERQWMDVGRAIAHIETSSRWWIGDWLLSGYRAYGKSVTFDLAQQATSYERTYLYGSSYVAKRYPPQRRVSALSWCHHEVLASFPPDVVDRLLALAVEMGLTSRQVRKMAEDKCGKKGHGRLRSGVKVFLAQEIENQLLERAGGMPLGHFIAQVVEEWITGKPVERYENGRRTNASRKLLKETLES